MANEIYWADHIIQKLNYPSYTIETAITPSGEIHLGNGREFFTGWALEQSALDQGKPTTFYFSLDDADALRKVYPFLPEHYSEFVGRPLYLIPDPKGCHASYSEHFSASFVEVLEQFGAYPKISRMHELYESGVMAPFIELALKNKDKIAQILTEVSGREIAPDWNPYN